MKDKFWVVIKADDFHATRSIENYAEYKFTLTHNNHIYISNTIDVLVDNGDNIHDKMYCYARLDTNNMSVGDLIGLVAAGEPRPAIPIIIEKVLRYTPLR